MKHWIILVLVFAPLALAQGKAFRNISFGDSLAEVTQQVLTDEAFRNQFDHPVRQDTTVPERVLELQSQYVTIGGQRYEIIFNFYDNKLFRLEFYSDDLTANYFDTDVKDLRDTLVSVISSAHGNPTTTYDVSFFDMQSGYIQWSHKWPTNAEGSAYKIGIGEVESTYYAAMWVEWSWLTELYEQATQADQEGTVEESSNDF